MVGASEDKRKFGHKVLQKYLDEEKKVTPVNPNRDAVCGIDAVSSVKEFKGDLSTCGISIVTPPEVTKQVLDEIKDAKGKWVWCQPGSEFDGIEECGKKANLKLLWGGFDVMTALEGKEQNLEEQRKQVPGQSYGQSQSQSQQGEQEQGQEKSQTGQTKESGVDAASHERQSEQQSSAPSSSSGSGSKTQQGKMQGSMQGSAQGSLSAGQGEGKGQSQSQSKLEEGSFS